MSIHGDQFLFPLFLRKDPNMPSITGTGELSLAFYLLTKDIQESEKIMSFSKILWPFLSIQGVISTHVLLDGLYLFNKKGRFTNPPRQALIGHILRNIENKSEIEVLNRVVDILTYKDKDAEEVGSGEESEYHTLQIDSLVNPEFLSSLIKLFNHVEIKPIGEYGQLDSSLTSDKALTIAEQYRNVIETLKGNSLRWQTVSELISTEANKWITELNVKIKDIDQRYSSQIDKTSMTIDNEQVQKKLEFERDKIDQWIVTEKKKVIENIALLFKTVDRSLEDIVKKNRFFCNESSLKTKVYEDLLPRFGSQFGFLKENLEELLGNIDNLESKYQELTNQGSRINSEAVVKIEELEASLSIKLQDRDQQLSLFEKEKTDNITDLRNLREQIETLFRQIYDIIQKKQEGCLKEAEDLKSWSIPDGQHEFFAKPIRWIFLPVYVIFIEDEDMMEERMNIQFPGFIANNINTSIYQPAGYFSDLKEILIKLVEDDMKVRSNFEFTSENKNLIQETNFDKKIIKGLSYLRSINLTNEEMEQKTRNILKSIM